VHLLTKEDNRAVRSGKSGLRVFSPRSASPSDPEEPLDTGGGRGGFFSLDASSMPLLVFWPHAGAWGAGVILTPCAQLLWCGL